MAPVKHGELRRCQQLVIIASSGWTLLALLVFVLVLPSAVSKSGVIWTWGANAGTLATLYGTTLTILIFLWTRARTRETTHLLDEVKEAADSARKAADSARKAATGGASAAVAAQSAAASAQLAAESAVEASDSARRSAEGAQRAASHAATRIDELAQSLSAAPADVFEEDKPVSFDSPVKVDEDLQLLGGERAVERTIVVSGIELRVMEPDRLPLRVIAELVNAWEVEGLRGKYRVEDLDGCARATGRGNFPWLAHFTPEPPDQWWRVAFGGQGKTTGTVERIALC